MPARIAEGSFLDGQTAGSRPVRIELRADGWLIARDASGVTRATWRVADVRIDTLHEGAAAHLQCPDQPEALLVTDDRELVRELVAAGARRSGLPEGRARLLVGAGSALAVFGMLAGFYLGSPWISTQVARQVPLDVERQLAPEVEGLLEDATCRDPAAEEVLQGLTNRLDPQGEIGAQVRVINLSLPNAFALPGGMVVLTRGLIEQAEDPDEITGVLAHELAHVRHRHVLAHMIRNAMLGAVWAVTLGDYSGLMVVDPDTIYQLATLRHSRDAESEADATGLELLGRAGISHAGLTAFFERHGSDLDDELSWVSTHPATSERVARLAAAPVPATLRPGLDAATLAVLRGACGDVPASDSLTDLIW